MNLDKLLSKIFGIEEQKFEFTQKEKDLLSEENPAPRETSIINVDNFSISDTYNPYEELLSDLFQEAKNFSLLEDQKVYVINIKELISYEVFSNLTKVEKKEFLHYLISKEEWTNNNSKVPENYRAMLANYLLRTTLPLTNKELIVIIKLWSNEKVFNTSPTNLFNQIHTERELMIFFDFWGKNTLPYTPEKTIVNRINKCVQKKSVSSDFYISLKALLWSRKIRYEEYRYCSYISNAIERILINYRAQLLNDHLPLFLVLPDHFGNRVNTKIIGLKNPYRTAFSKLLHTFSNSTTVPISTPKHTYDSVHELIPVIGKKMVSTLIFDTLQNAIQYKSKVKSIPVTYIYYGKRFKVDYKPLPKENISIISGLMLLSSYLKIDSCLSVIPVIIERAYARVGKKRGYGKGSRVLGIVGIQILACFSEKKGQTMLLQLYNETKSKSIKKQIEEESENLKNKTGTSLL
ncbi:hypothetical protein [uncultured Aquimarina sp.]|uniref:hypothetical protein n=1 Tax=uncultured Aquimarina sp. TaxID=575652 RepID=UPI0026220CA7|nr:hypothetical protein [uncultured Aquimarina sp.]